VEVYRASPTGAWNTGTGFLLDGGLVLTAAHVVGGSGGTALVRIPGNAEPLPSTIVWHRYDEPPGTGVDAALLRVDDHFRPSRTLPPMAWGRLAATRGTRRVEAVGFPAGMDLLTDGTLTFRDSAHVVAEITPGSRFKAGRYEMAVRTPVPPARPRLPTPSSLGLGSRPASRWSGMSGAGILCEGLLVGLVVVDPGDPAGGALTAVPVESVLADPKASQLLGDVRLHSVELAPVLLPPPTPSGSPVGLLRAEVSPVACRGREAQLASLTDWCRTPGRFSLRLLTGPGGQGKTRLAREMVERLTTSGWAAGFLDEQCPDDRLGLLADLSDPLLLVLDYAETRSCQLRLCLRALRPESGSGMPVRLLLLARGAGEWWRQARADARALRDLPSDAVAELEPLAPDARGRAEAVRLATADLRPALAALSGEPRCAGAAWSPVGTGSAPAPRTTGSPPSGLARKPEVPLGFDNRRHSSALALNMAALTALLDSQRPSTERPVPPRDAAEALLRHEERYWTQTAAVHGIGHLHPATLRQLVTCATLYRAADLREARRLLAGLGCMAGETANTRLGAAVWLHELYGGPENYWAGLLPDPLGAHQAGSTLRDFPELLHELVDRVGRHRAVHLLRVLCRAREPFPELSEQITHLVRTGPRSLALACVDLLTQEHDEVLAGALDALLADPGTEGDLLADLLSAVPRHTENLAHSAVFMAQRHVARLRAMPDTPTVRLADALRTLAHRLSAAGRHTEAVVVAEEAVRLCPDTESGKADTELIEVLLGYGARLDEVGRHAEAASVGDRLLALPGIAVGILDQGPDGTGAADLAGGERLARILHHHACWCHRAGRADEALQAGARSVTLRRLLAAQDPGRPPDELAGSLLNHALYLQAAGSIEAAVAPLREAVATLRRLVEQSPDAHLAALGRALHDQGRLHAVLGDPGRALACAEEAVAIHRRLAATGTSPPRTAELASVLVGLAARLADADHLAPALAAVTEAVDLRRVLAAEGTASDTARLAVVLTDQAVLLRRSGNSDEAECVTEEAVRILATARAAGWTPTGPAAARVLMQRGLALAARHPARAREFLEEAVDEALRRGATELADRCTAALQQVGTPPPQA
jgi:tetratricopeptide (TPR) repeat protein